MLVPTQLTMFSDGDSGDAPDWPFVDYETEHALLFGLGSRHSIVIRELCVWQREWARSRDRILEKFIEVFPGRRPAAMYIVGEVPLRPMHMPLPLASELRHTRCVYVNCGDDGFTYADLPEPYQTDEAMHLYAAGVIDADERRRYRGYSRSAGLRHYPWDIVP